MTPLQKFIARCRERAPGAPLITEQVLGFVDQVPHDPVMAYHWMAKAAREDRDRRVADPNLPSVQP